VIPLALTLLLAAGGGAPAEAGATTAPAVALGAGSSAIAAAPAALTEPEAVAVFEQASARYLAGDFEGAARGWHLLLEQGWESPALHLDLGNALARAGARGPAMASWLRGLRLDPSDPDLAANLEAARAQNVDRLVGAAELPLTSRLVERTADGLALGLFGVSWAALWLLLWLWSRAARRSRRLLGLGALLAAAVTVAGAALLAGKAIERRTPTAVVVAPVAPVREGPERTLKSAFELHEGTVVRVLEGRGELVRVRLDNGLTGWVAAAQLEPL